jgi:hypothetical protein
VLGNDARQDVLTEIVMGLGVLRIGEKDWDHELGVEDVDAHGDVDHLGVEGGAEFGLFGLFFKAGDFSSAGDLDDTEGGDLVGADGQGGEGDVGAGFGVLL